MSWIIVNTDAGEPIKTNEVYREIYAILDFG